MGTRPTGSKTPVDLPLRRAMPKPLLIVFALLNVAALSIAVMVLLRPGTLEQTPIAERRPAPSKGFSHDPGQVFPAPTPSEAPVLESPCTDFDATRIVMAGDGVLRVRSALDKLCRLTGGGVGGELATALRGLGSATIRFAQFERTAIESTLGINRRIIWLNLRFARADQPVELMLPPMIHEAYHIGSGSSAPDVFREIEARRAELDACKELIAREDWPRYCRDAEYLATLPIDKAVAELRAAGFGAP